VRQDVHSRRKSTIRPGDVTYVAAKIWFTSFQYLEDKTIAMRKKVIAVGVVVGLAVVLAMGLRTINRADAAASDCFSDTQGPSTPTICN
jgi:hypothetical protein